MLTALDGKTKRAKGRQGLATLTLLITAVVIIAGCALAMDVAFVSNKQVQLEVAAEAAARAAASDLMDSGAILRAGWGEGASLRSQILQAQEQAIWIAAGNTVASRPVTLRPNLHNDPQGDTVVGWVSDPSQLGASMIPWAGAGPLNSVNVQCVRTGAGGNPLTFWFARRLGMAGADRVITARATVDQRVYGFRPVHDVTVPVLPLVQVIAPTLESADPKRADQRDCLAPWMAAARGSGDCYAVDARGPLVSSGKDGIGERLLHLPPTGQTSCEPADRLAVWMSCDLRRGQEQLRRQILHGLDVEDLQAMGGRVEVGDLVAASRIQSGFDQGSQMQLLGSLRKIRGHKRVWPVLTPIAMPGVEGGGGYKFVGFVAGCVVDCLPGSDGGMSIVVQPVPLQTCTALVGPGVPINPWIGKLVMTQ